MDTFLAAFPLVVVVVLMAGPKPLPAIIALPITALLTFFIRLVWFGNDTVALLAHSVAGIIAAITPILIVGGAVILFQALERAGALRIWRQWLDSLNPHPIARLMTVAWSFVYLIEGASGFGTPAALAAPILVACGMSAIRAAAICLVFDTFPVSFGAVGTPMWFGFGSLGIDEQTVLAVSARTGLINAIIAVPVVVVSLRLVVQWRTIANSLVFIVLCVLGCVVPAAVVAGFGSEFPSLIGGAVGLVWSVLLARCGWGLGAVSSADQVTPAIAKSEVDSQITADEEKPSGWQVLQAFSPLLICVALLVLTRMPFLPFKAWFTTAPSTVIDVGIFKLGLSPGGHLLIVDIFATTARQGLQILWVPGVIPFILVAFLTPLLLGQGWGSLGRSFTAASIATWQRLQGAAIALVAGLILVKLLQHGTADTPASTAILGSSMATSLGPLWLWVAPWLGALGSFFSGSGTMSNLTFGPVQQAVATELDLDLVTILALQTIGGGLGNMVCIHNIVAVSGILGLQKAEGTILRLNALPMVFYALMAAGGALVVGLLNG